jgi:hypothetical protein
MKPRTGYYTEQNRNQVFRQIIEDENFRSGQHKKILFALVAAGDGLTMHEITAKTGIAVHIVSARLYELRAEDLNWVITKFIDKSHLWDTRLVTRINPETGKPNTVFFINEDKFKTKKQLELFK